MTSERGYPKYGHIMHTSTTHLLFRPPASRNLALKGEELKQCLPVRIISNCELCKATLV